MNNNDGMLDEAKAQEAYEDALFKLAMIRLEEKRMEQLIKESEEGDNVLNLQKMQSDYQSSLPMIRKKVGRELKRCQRRRFLKGLSKTGRAAAGILLVLYMSATVALSTSAEAREYVGKLLINVRSDHSEVNMLSAERLHSFVPSEWKGEYFIKYIPNGFFLMNVDCGNINRVTYLDSNANELRFLELTSPARSNLNTEYAVSDYVYVNGSQALRSQDNGKVMLTWPCNDRYFVLYFDGSPKKPKG